MGRSGGNSGSGSTKARPRSPPQAGSKRCSAESNGAQRPWGEHRAQRDRQPRQGGIQVQRELVGHVGPIVAGALVRVAAAAERSSHVPFSAPIDGSYELWRIAVDDAALERLSEGRHDISVFDQRPTGESRRIAYLRSSPTELPDAWVVDAAGRNHSALTSR